MLQNKISKGYLQTEYYLDSQNPPDSKRIFYLVEGFTKTVHHSE